MLLEVRELIVKYGQVEALSGISIEIDEREIVCLLGANGAGKTTTLQAICGAGVIAAGDIYFDGDRIQHLQPHIVVRKGIVHVPEGKRLFPEMNVLENLELGAYLQSDPKAKKRRLEEVLTFFPILAKRLKQHAESLSGGEQQMLAIGRALMGNPRLLLMDEPTMGLSPIMGQAVEEWLVQINQRGISILLAEQNARLALAVSHRGYVLELGKIVIQGKAHELTEDERIRHAYLGTAQTR